MRVEIYSFKSFSSIIIPTFMFHRGTVREREGEEAEKTGGGGGKGDRGWRQEEEEEEGHLPLNPTEPRL